MSVLTVEAASLDAAALVAALAHHHPALFAAIRTEGAAAERERIQAVRQQLMPGHEQLIEQLAFDGKTTGPEAAVAVVNAERAAAEARRAALAKDAPPALPAAASATGEEPAKTKPAGDALDQAQAMANEIAKVQAEHAAVGRQINAIQAMAIVKQQQAAAA